MGHGGIRLRERFSTIFGITDSGSRAHEAELPVPPPPLQAVSADIDRYAKATEALRTTAKWLLTALAAVGAALIAGLQLTKIGNLDLNDWPRLVAAALGLTIALGSVGYMIQQVSKIFTDEWITLAELDNEALDLALREPDSDVRRLQLLKDLRQAIEKNRQELFADVAETIPGLHRALRLVNEETRTLVSREFVPTNRTMWAAAWATTVRRAAAQVTDYANYRRTQDMFARIKPRLALAASLAAFAVGVFAYSTSPEEPQSPMKVEIVNTTP